MELKVCSLVRMGMASKDIASLLGLSVYTINTHRRNARATLKLESDANLAVFLASL